MSVLGGWSQWGRDAGKAVSNFSSSVLLSTKQVPLTPAFPHIGFPLESKKRTCVRPDIKFWTYQIPSSDQTGRRPIINKQSRPTQSRTILSKITNSSLFE